MATNKTTIEQARALYIQRRTVTDIARELDITRTTVYRWIDQYGWERLRTEGSPWEVTEQRLTALLVKGNKTAEELAEIELLIGVLERLEKLEQREQNRQVAKDETKKRPRKTQRKSANNFTGLDEGMLMEEFRNSQFDYQFDLYGFRDSRVRNLLKSRQIGFTRYFSAEALVDALLTGQNQIFISASRAQAEVFRDYIKGFALDWFDKELKGKDKIELMTDNGLACLYFLSIEQVQQFYPRATPIHYTLESKTRLVLKAQEVIGQGRILWDSAWSDIAARFMQIHRTTTNSGQITYVADRSQRTGHADSAWAIMHTLINEGLNYRNLRPSCYVFGDDHEQAA